MTKLNLQMFAPEEGTITTSDLAPAISVDYTSRLRTDLEAFKEAIGLSEMAPMANGSSIKVYKMVKTTTPSQVGEGEEIPLTKIERKLAATYDLVFKKYRKNTTAESVQKFGRDVAVNKTDEKLISEVQNEILTNFYTVMKTGTGTATGTNLQTALANLWAELKKYYKNMAVKPVFFINPTDVANYLGTAQVNMANAFGMTYITNFLGLGTAIISPEVEAGKPIATVAENIGGYYVPATGDLGETFQLTTDETGFVGMTHAIITGNASIETLMFSGVCFFPEFVDGVFKATITAV